MPMNTRLSLDTKVGEAAKKPFESDCGLCSGELESEAKMYAGTE